MQLNPLDVGIFVVYMLAVLGLGSLASLRGTRTSAIISWPATSFPGG